MNNMEAVGAGTEASFNVLKQALDQSGRLAEDLIKMNVENMINANQLEYMGNVIDVYA